jgi:DNA-binding IclR family transcriptional regulator
MRTVQSIERAISLLKAFSAEQPELGVAELSRRLDLAKSTVFRLLQTLEVGGLVSQNPQTGSYRLGVEILSLAENVLAYADLQKMARPHLRALADSVRETVNLSVFEGQEVVNLEQFVTPGKLVMRVGWVGRRMPAFAVSSGRAILAFLPEEALDHILSGELQPITEHTITDPAALRAELARVRELGYSAVFEEFEIGLHAVSAPIRDHEGDVIASVSISGPSYRLPEEDTEEIAAQLVETTDRVSYDLGYRGGEKS